MTPDPVLAVIVLIVAGFLIDLAVPQRGMRSWDNTRAATQRDVADVIGGRRPGQTGPRVLPLVVFGIVVLAVAMLFGGSQ